jgi:hypothetical protein
MAPLGVSILSAVVLPIAVWVEGEALQATDIDMTTLPMTPMVLFDTVAVMAAAAYLNVAVGTATGHRRLSCAGRDERS